MKLVTIGDSITLGTYTKNGDNAPMSIANPNFSDILKEKCSNLCGFADKQAS